MSVAIVTGAGSGIGRATAQALAKEGHAVASLDVNVDGIVAGTPFHCDVRDEDTVNAVVAQVASELGRPEIVCNVAGVGRFAHTTEATLDDWNLMVGVNLTGTFLVCRAALPHLLDGGGVIVNVASTAGLMGQPYSAAYCASKGGVVMLTKALAFEYIERGVRVNAVAPGGVETPMFYGFMPEQMETSRRLMRKMVTPMGVCAPDEIAGVIAFVASPACRYMTGSVVPVDGGLTI